MSDIKKVGELHYDDMNIVAFEENTQDVCSQIISIVKKSPGSRTINECRTVGTFLSEIKFLEKLDRNVLSEIGKYVYLKEFQTEEVVFSHGDIGNEYYII